jgi:hypothetical protein
LALDLLTPKSRTFESKVTNQIQSITFNNGTINSIDAPLFPVFVCGSAEFMHHFDALVKM